MGLSTRKHKACYKRRLEKIIANGDRARVAVFAHAKTKNAGKAHTAQGANTTR